MTIVDLHTHGADSYDFRWNLPGIRGRPYSRTDIGEKMVEHCFKTEKSTLVGVINFDDNRWQGIFEDLRRVNGYEIFDSDYLVSLVRDGKRISFVVGQEIPTDRGHVLIVGAGKNIEGRVLYDVLKNARDLNGLVIADHPLASVIGLQEEAIDKYRDYFDAIEVCNSNYSGDIRKRQEELASRFRIPGIAASDSHSVSKVFSSYTRFDNLDFSDANKLKASMRNCLRSGSYSIERGTNGRLEAVRHVVAVASALSGLKLGILKRGKYALS